jgi:hypothetical protein
VLELFYTPIPSRGYGVHLNITHGALCALALAAALVALLFNASVRLTPA